MSVFILLDQSIRRPDDLLPAAVIGLHEKDPCSRVSVLKGDKCLRVSCPEAVDTLVFISHHKQIPALRRQQVDHIMLYFRSILRFIHTEIPILLPEMCKYLRILFQNSEGVDHLIIVIDHLHLPEFRIISTEYLREFLHIRVHIPDFLRCQTHIFRIGDIQLGLFDIIFRGVFPRYFQKRLFDGRRGFLICHLKRRFPGTVGKILQYLLGDAVDGAKLQPLCIRFSEHPRKPPAHIIRCRHRIGHCQDRLRCYSQAIDHIAQSADQYGGLTASWNRKKQYRTFRGLYRLHLLFV